MPNRGKHLLDNAIMFGAFSGGSVGVSTQNSSAVALATARARMLNILMTLGAPVGGTPSVQFKWQSTPNSPFVFIDIPGGTGDVTLVPAAGQLAIAKLDVDFVPSGHTFVRGRLVITGSGTFNFQGQWICEDLDELPPRIYTVFPQLRPLELAIMDSTLSGTNQS
ncbi:MAG: hypothetical protein ACREIS_05690 [Nitrospiraceae bacterium]